MRHSLMRRLGVVVALGAAVVLMATGAQAATSYFNGFETNTTGWTDNGGTINRVASGDASTAYASGVSAATGGFFARLGLDPASVTCPSGGGPQPVYAAPYTDWGGASSTFPAGGFSTAVDIYLDVNYATANLDTRFDWDSAISDTSGNYRRGFVFNVGTDGSGFVITGGNNATRCGADPYSTDPSHAPRVSVTQSGWYTFKHTFTNVSGVLSVQMDLIQLSSGTVMGTWTRSDSSDTIGAAGTVGGNNVGSFDQSEFDGLAIDNSRLAPPKCRPTGFMRDGINLTAAQIGGNVTGPLDATTCNIGVYYDNTTSGNVTAGANISGANYFGVVVNGDVGTVKVNVTGSAIHDIGESPLTGQGSQHGTAIYYRAFGGTASGTISGNTLTNYQKGGITTNGSVSATITKNTVTGQGPVAWIAQNGIQVGYGTKATVTGNTVTGNAYTGAGGTSSAGILVVGGSCFGLPLTVGLDISKNTLTNNDVGVWLFNADTAACTATTAKTNNSVKFNTISNAHVTNTTGFSPTCGYQAGVADVGTKDLIVNNSISGVGYTPQTTDCGGTPPAFLRFVDPGSKARAVPSNK